MHPPPRLILASSSRYRQELLGRLRLAFEVAAPDLDETPHPDEAPHDTALRLALQKAQAISVREQNALIIGSDQVAVLDGEPIGKPGNHANALAQLCRMQGRSVVFHTALCLLDNRSTGNITPCQLTSIATTVTFRTLPESQLDAYLRIEQPYDCAGSAKNEGLGIILIEAIDSTDPTALTGLPLIALTSMLMRSGVTFSHT